MDPTVGDVVFLDTNILLTGTDRQREQHAAVLWIIAHAGRAGLHLAVSGQILREYMVVATRPLEANGFGLSATDALTNVDQFMRHAMLYEETEAVSTRLRSLIETCGLRGKRIHDGNVAATMIAHGVKLLLTQNPGDFKDIPGVHVLDISSIVRFLDREGQDV